MTGKCKGGLLVAALLLLSAAAAGCGMEEMASVWRDRPVVIDGRDDGAEWKGALHTVAKGELAVGVLNDERMLYLRLSTRNRAIQRQILKAGLTLWFDETGGQAKSYGIRFPLPRSGPSADRMPPQGRDGGEMKGPDNDRVGPGAFADIKGPGPSGAGSLAAVQSDIEVFRPDSKEYSTIAAESSSPGGLRCRLGISAGNLVYEIQIPLLRSEATRHGIALAAMKAIGVGVITGQDEQPQQSPGGWGGGPGGGGPGGGMGGDRGGRGGAMGAPPQGPPGGRDAAQEKTQSVEQWLKVRLAERH